MNEGTNMLYTHFTQEVLELQDVIVRKIESNEKELTIYIELERKQHNCISCGTATDAIHNYRKQIIKDIYVFGKSVNKVLRRYRGPHV